MGSLKRKNASLPSSSSSSYSKRASRDCPSLATGNGYALRRTHAHSSARQHTDPHLNGALLPVPETRALTVAGLISPGRKEEDRPQHQYQEEKQEQGILLTEHDSQNAEHRTGSREADLADVEDASLPLIPNHAGWFSWDKIHEIERRRLPNFFNSKSKFKTPSLYMKYRNIFMRKYLKNPDNLFTWVDASSIVTAEDSNGGFKVAAKCIFEFLDHWGLINFKALRNSKASMAKQKSTSDYAKGSILSSLYRFDSPSERIISRYRPITEMPAVMTGIVDTAITDLQEAVPGPGPAVDYHCNSCSTDCSKRRFHCQKQADFDLCPKCFSEGKFSMGITSTDFILMEAASEANITSSGGWSDQETLLLLEALEMFGDNFIEIADHVATKTKAQCILHFIRLPIEDPFLEGSESLKDGPSVQPSVDLGNSNKVTGLSGQGDQDGGSKSPPAELIPTKDVEDGSVALKGLNDDKAMECGNEEVKSSIVTNIILEAAQAAGLASSEKLSSFGGCSNPIMALMSFLAALVTPESAAKSAEASLRAVSEQMSVALLSEKNSYRLETEVLKSDVDGCQQERVTVEGASAVSEFTVKVPENGMTCVDEEKVEKNDDSSAPVSTFSSAERIRGAACTALSAAAVKAKFLAEKEEWEILRLAASVVDSQYKKIETKMKLLRDFNATLVREQNALERSMQRAFSEHIQMAKSRGIAAASASQYIDENAALSTVQRLQNACDLMVPHLVAPSMQSDVLRGNVFPGAPSIMEPRPPHPHMRQFTGPMELQKFTYRPK